VIGSTVARLQQMHKNSGSSGHRSLIDIVQQNHSKGIAAQHCKLTACSMAVCCGTAARTLAPTVTSAQVMTRPTCTPQFPKMSLLDFTQIGSVLLLRFTVQPPGPVALIHRTQAPFRATGLPCVC